MTGAPDLTNLPRFLEHLGERDAASADFARALLEAGGTVQTFWGPEQMDVWELRVQHGEMVVRFGIERGYADGVLIAPSTGSAEPPQLRPMRLAAFAWARANGVAVRLEDPDDIDVDLAAHGIAVLDWVAAGHQAEVERVHVAWLDYQRRLGRARGRTHGGSDDSALRAARAAGVRVMEAAADPAV